MSAPFVTEPISCSSSNATVVNICCSQVGLTVQVSTVSGILPLSPSTAPFPTTAVGTPAPQVPLTATCQWTPSSNSTGETEIEDWMTCANQYGKTTTGSVCLTPSAFTSSGRTQRGPTRWISAMLLGGAIVQVVFAIQS